ncbi:MAG: helix-turn-helix domain-containing protein [Bacteroidota bacterium]
MILPNQIHKTNPYIKKYWVIDNPSSAIEKVLNPMISDAHLEILFIEGQGIHFTHRDQTYTFTAGIYFSGHVESLATLILLPETKIHFIKLHHWASVLVTKFSFSALQNQIVSLADLNASLYKKLRSFDPSGEMSSIICLLLQELDASAIGNTNFHIIKNACQKLSLQHVEFKTLKQEILVAANISDRTLETKFKNHVGLTPKQFSMTLKIRNAAEAILYNPSQESLANVAFDNGFYDQSHFSRSFKSLFGKSPRNINFSKFFIPNSAEDFRYYTI